LGVKPPQILRPSAAYVSGATATIIAVSQLQYSTLSAELKVISHILLPLIPAT